MTKKKTYILLLIIIFASSFVSVLSKIASRYELFSFYFILFYGLALAILAIYAVIWQLCLEHINLISAYMARGLLYVCIYIWSSLIFHVKKQKQGENVSKVCYEY